MPESVPREKREDVVEQKLGNHTIFEHLPQRGPQTVAAWASLFLYL